MRKTMLGALVVLIPALMPLDAVAAPGKPGHKHTIFAAGVPGNPKKPFRVIELTMTEGSGTMGYSPNLVEVKQGEQIKFVITNAGELDHEFLLDSIEGNAKHKIEMEKNPEMEHDDPNSKRLPPKKSAEILWRFPKQGKFEFACLIPGHYEAGMKGTVVVTPARPAIVAKNAKDGNGAKATAKAIRVARNARNGNGSNSTISTKSAGQ